MTPSTESSFDLSTFIINHLTNATIWHPSFLPEVVLPSPLTVHSLMLLFCAVLLIILVRIFYHQDQKVPSGATNALEALVLFIRDDIAVANLGEEDGRKFTPLFCTFFFFILFMNLLGSIPFFATPTANINVTFALAMVTLGFMTIGAIVRNGVKGFFKAFIIHDLALPARCFVFFSKFLVFLLKPSP